MVEITLDKPRRFEMNAGALLRLEAKTGKGIATIFTAGMSFTDICATLWACNQDGATFDEIVNAINLKHLPEITEALIGEMSVCFGEEKKTETPV